MFLNLFNDFGQIPLCNKNPDRALHINDFVFPLCYRCMMLWIGVIFGTLVIFLFKEKYNLKFKIKHFILGVILIVPTFLDGLIQTLTIYESTNIIRSVTGVIAGAGFGLLIVIIQQYLEEHIIKFKKQRTYKK